MSDENKKLGTCQLPGNIGSVPHEKDKHKYGPCLAWREQPAQGEPNTNEILACGCLSNCKGHAQAMSQKFEHEVARVETRILLYAMQETAKLREERDALKRELDIANRFLETERNNHHVSILEWQRDEERAERAESALAEALELLGVMYGWAKYGEESDHWYYSEEQAPGWKADSERASKLLGFKLKAKP